MSVGTLYTTSDVEKKRVRYSSTPILSSPRYHLNSLCSSQISAIAAFAGLSVEVKEGTADIIKTPTLVCKDGFSVFEASAIGRYGESY